MASATIGEFCALVYNQTMKTLLPLALAMLLWTLAACSPAPTPVPAPTATPEAAHHAPATPEIPTLTLWLPDWMILPEAAGQETLNQVTAAFASEKNVSVQMIPKLATGKGGLLDALRTTKPVAPAILPDIIALPLQEIPQAGSESLLQPLNEQLPDAMLDDLYPFARQASQNNEAWMAVPFAADFEHLSFQPAVLSDPPVNWDIILASKKRYSFPVGSADSTWTDALLLHYLSATTSSKPTERDSAALRRQLAFYQALYQAGQTDADMLQTANPRGSWEQSLQGAVPLAETTARLWLSQQGDATFLRFGPTPTQDGQARYLIQGWAYAIITADETQQALAADLIKRLTEPQTLARWSIQAHILPANRASLQQWPASDYRNFANESLENGFLMPAFSQDEAFTRAVHQASRAVLSGERSAEEAWKQAIASW